MRGRIEICKNIDFTAPGDSAIGDKGKKNIEKCQNLAKELQKIWNVRVQVILLAIVLLGVIPKHFGKRLKDNR